MRRGWHGADLPTRAASFRRYQARRWRGSGRSDRMGAGERDLLVPVLVATAAVRPPALG
jgi:hypothetical protein